MVGVVRRAARTRRVGHAGTLDPFATGLLVIAVGTSTRLLPYFVGEPKVYDATFQFGADTDTDDGTGRIIREAAAPGAELLTDPLNAVRLAAELTLTGRIAQVPPQYSAKHVDGTRAYDLARKGEVVDLAPVPVHVHRWEWRGAGESTLDVRITCGGGTYIRALARDLGRALGSAAHCSVLRRVQSGPASVDQAVTFDALAPGRVSDGEVALRSPLELLGDMATQTIDETGVAALRFGRTLEATVSGAQVALLHEGAIAALGVRIAGDRWQPRVVLIGANG
jgi:tRNA pseudouridine55 synthase